MFARHQNRKMYDRCNELSRCQWLRGCPRSERCSTAAFRQPSCDTPDQLAIIQLAALHPEYISLSYAVSILINHDYFGAAESTLHEASAVGPGGTHWTLECAFKRGFVRLLDHRLRLNCPSFNHKCCQLRLRYAIGNDNALRGIDQDEVSLYSGH